MRPSPTVAKLLALLLAVAAHGALAFVLMPSEEIEMEGASGATEVRLGNAFADMAAGTLSPTQADTTTEVVPIEETPRDTVARVTPAEPETASRAEESEAAPVTALAALTPETALPLSAEASPPAEARATPESAPIEALDASRPQPQATHMITPDDRLIAEPEASPAISRSLRPKPRSAEFEEAHKPAPQPAQSTQDRQPTPTGSTSTGNAQQNTRAGAATGTSDATATQSGTDGRSEVAGNAAASNYPGLVMQRLSQAGRPPVNARGTAVVAFNISGNGGLASVSLARSSGSSTLDQAAVQLVRGAGPFPPPPEGAQRSFSIQIKGR